MFNYKLISRGVRLSLVVFVAILSAGYSKVVSANCQSINETPHFSFDAKSTSEKETQGKRIFYVSSSGGDDDANGETSRTAWRTIAKVNSSKFKPGDQILFKRGDVWREELKIPTSGANNLPIVFGAYPASGGKAPVISGSDIVINWKITADKIYRAPLDTEPRNIYIDDQPAPLARCGEINDVKTNDNSWFYDAAEKFLYVKLAKQDSPAKHNVEAAVRNYNIYAESKSYIKIENLELKNARRSGILAERDGSDFWTILNCDIHNATEAAIYARPNDRKGVPLLRGWVVQNNRIGRLDGKSKLDYDSAGILLRHVKDAVIENNTVVTVNKMGITIRDYFSAGGSEGGLVSGNKLTANQGNISIWMTSNASVTRNVIYKSKGYGIGVGVRSYNTLITYNSINNLRESDDGVLFNGIDINADSQNGRIYQNTIVNVRGFNLTLEQSDAPSNGWKIINNIFDARQAPYYKHSNIAVDPLVISYTFASNLYVGRAQRPTIVNHWHRQDMTLAQWMMATNDKNSFVADPQFIDEANNDLRLGKNSPARGKAQPLPGINDGKPLNIGAF